MEIPKIAISLQPLSERKSPIWCGSSVWLECRPVTPEVESSSLFRTAKCLRIFRGIFCFCRGSATAILLVFRWSHEQPGSANSQYPDVEDYLSPSLHPCFLRYCSTPAFSASLCPCFSLSLNFWLSPSRSPLLFHLVPPLLSPHPPHPCFSPLC